MWELFKQYLRLEEICYLENLTRNYYLCGKREGLMSDVRAVSRVDGGPGTNRPTMETTPTSVRPSQSPHIPLSSPNLTILSLLSSPNRTILSPVSSPNLTIKPILFAEYKNLFHKPV